MVRFNETEGGEVTETESWEQRWAREADWNREDWGPPSLPADHPRIVRTPGNSAHLFLRGVRWARTALRRERST